MFFNLDEIIINTGGSFFYKKSNNIIFNKKYEICFSNDTLKENSICFISDISLYKQDLNQKIKGFIIEKNGFILSSFKDKLIKNNNPDFILLIDDINSALKNLTLYKRQNKNSKIIMVSGEYKLNEITDKIKNIFNPAKIIETKTNPYINFLSSSEEIETFIIKCDDYELNLKEFAIYFSPEYCATTPLSPKRVSYGRIARTASSICKIAYPVDIYKKILSDDNLFYRSYFEKSKAEIIYTKKINDEKELLNFFKPVN